MEPHERGVVTNIRPQRMEKENIMPITGFDLQGKKAVVVGAASPVGRAVALALAEAGADLALTPCTRSVAEQRQLDASLTAVAKLGRHCQSFAVDVASEEDVRHMVDTAVAALGKLDILVNAIDLPFGKPLAETTSQEWAHVVTGNLTAVFNTTKHVGRHMLAQGSGKIVNVTSMLGDRGLANATAYCAAKGGVVQFTKAAALEWARRGITVNAIGLGWMEGDPLAQENDPEMKSRLTRYLPIHRLGQPEEIGALAVYLASAASDFMTGHTIFVDGGALSHS
ncbi:MAG: SDR family oxidoreductase [Dehalococcoidia bacterium]|nr:SDR family oxidoreductase [Dehalococcoidia bacterium]